MRKTGPTENVPQILKRSYILCPPKVTQSLLKEISKQQTAENVTTRAQSPVSYKQTATKPPHYFLYFFFRIPFSKQAFRMTVVGLAVTD